MGNARRGEQSESAQLRPVKDDFYEALPLDSAPTPRRRPRAPTPGILLALLGWPGQILRSSKLPARPGRSQRLADLAEATGACAYLCGTGGMKYLKTECFDAIGVCVIPFRIPDSGIWAFGRENSALTPLMQAGFGRTAYELLALAARYRAVNRRNGSAHASCSAGPAGPRSGRPDPR